MATYYPQLYVCAKCASSQKHYVWSDEVETATQKCSTPGCDSTNLEPCDEPKGSSPALLGFRNQQNLKERRKRNKKHFKQHVLPTVTDPDVKKHHFNKLGIKN